ncbi:MAG: ATP-binding response regulator, partial [Acetobacteraceae bacterium]
MFFMISARTGEESRVEGLEAGADEYLVKPFSARALLACVRGTLALAQQRRQAARAALHTADQLRSLFDQAPGFMALLRGPGHVIETANAAYLRLAGNRHVIGKRVRDAFPEIREQGYFERLDEAYRTGQPFVGQGIRILLQNAEGAPVAEKFLDFVYQPFRNQDGAVIGIFVEGAEVTERKRAEDAVRASEERLRRLNQGLESRVREEVAAREATQAQLAHAQRMEALGQLTGGIAHDFNNIIQAVRAGAEMIERDPGDAERVCNLARLVVEAAERGAAVTRRLLTFSRRADLRAEPVDATSLLGGVAEILSDTLGAGITVQVETEPALPLLFADKSQLETALVNLATNARDAMQGTGTLSFGAAADTVREDDVVPRPIALRPGPYVRIEAADTGSGMTLEVLARASEPFFTTKAMGKGTGLGLAMVRGFAEQSGGGFAIDSAPGRG